MLFSAKPTSTARVIPKSSEKCSLIFNGIPVNSADSRQSKGFRLPHVKGLWDFLPARLSPICMAKFDISSFFLVPTPPSALETQF